MFSSVYNWAVSKVGPPSTIPSPSPSIDECSPSPHRPPPIEIHRKVSGEDEFILINTPDIKPTPPPTPQLLIDFNECIINDYQENKQLNDSPSGIDFLSSPSPLPSSPLQKDNFEESKEETPNINNAVDEKIGFRVLRFTRDGLIKNETNLPLPPSAPSPSTLPNSPPSSKTSYTNSRIRNLYKLALSGNSGALFQLKHFARQENQRKRLQEIGVSMKRLTEKKRKSTPNNKPTISIDDDNEWGHPIIDNSLRDKVIARQHAKNVLQQQRRANGKSVTKERRAAADYKSGGGL